MSDPSKVIKVRKFPLEAEAIARMGQVELTSLRFEDLLAYSQQTVLVMSQLRHYCQEIMNALDEKGFTIESEDG
jgi:hypothetical protein